MKIKKRTVYICDLCGEVIKEDRIFRKAKIEDVYVDSRDNKLKKRATRDICTMCWEKMIKAYRSETLKNDKNIL